MPNVVLNLQPPTRIQVCTLFMSNTMLIFIIDIVHLISCALGSCSYRDGLVTSQFLLGLQDKPPNESDILM
jgi:hypothetical protein